ncbi:glycosyltransferase [Azoarcus sp. L1K30]|uniref:glycosyltransferase n=1 Tax=Azoarcus sp. L1K30 TaxID=2820277 RepID=UPI001B824756|nr:glycosyltransferase [Azoarcus sp. L1K30]MBR0566011.1 glycosyltransferase [Azoarcus sp. L1K30]
MRVLHIGKFFPPDPGGMETFLADLAEAQRAAGDESFALVHGTPMDEDPSWLIRVPVSRQILYTPIAPAFRAHLKSAIRRIKPDVLHLHMPNPSAFWALTLSEACDIPWVVHWHSDVIPTLRRSALSLAYQVYRPFEQAVLKRAQHVIVTSPDYLAASVPLQRWRDKCRMVPLALDTRKLPAHPPGLAVDPWPAGTFRLLSVGRLSHYKGYQTLIDAVAGMDGVHLVIAGDGEDRLALQAHIKAQGRDARTTLVGRIDESTKHALLAQCDAFCLASRERTEAFGIAVMEAMYYARPCLVSALSGSALPWLVTSSQAGLTVPVGDLPRWRAAISTLRADPDLAAIAGTRGRAAILKRFDIAPSTAAIRSIYPRPEIDPVRFSQPLVVIPARNEAPTIEGVIAAVRAQGLHHIVVVSDQSTDDTAAIARAADAVVLEPVLSVGAWGAMQTGIRYAMRNGYRQVITLHANGQHEPSCLPEILAAAMTADVVIGASTGHGSRTRRLAWSYFRTISGFRIDDLTSGLRCYSRAACEILASEEATLLDYKDLGVLLLLRNAGLSIMEVPVEMHPRASVSPRVFTGWARIARYMMESTLLCISRGHPKHFLKQ